MLNLSWKRKVVYCWIGFELNGVGKNEKRRKFQLECGFSFLGKVDYG